MRDILPRMPDWLNQCAAGRVQAVSEGWTAANVGGVSVTAGAINTKGAWAVISAVTPFDADGIFVELMVKSSAADQLIDIGIGASGQEGVYIPNIYYAGGSNSAYGKTFFFPFSVAAGSRLVARSQSATASVTARVAVHLMQAGTVGLPTCRNFFAFGADIVNSRGTPLADPAAGAWGAWTQLSAVIGQELKWIMPIYGDRALGTRTAGNRYAGQLGIGAAGVEYGIGPEQGWYSSSTALSINGFHGWWQHIEANQRLSGRTAVLTAASLGVDCIAYGGV